MIDPSPTRDYRNPHDPSDPEPWGPADSLPPSAPLAPNEPPGPGRGRRDRAHGRGRGRRSAAVVTVGVLALGAAWYGAGFLGSDVTTEVTAPVTAVQVTAGNTAVRVSYADVPQTRIIEHDRRQGSRLEQRVVNGELIVEYRGGGFRFGPSRERLEVVLPQGTAAETPDVQVRGTTGSIKVDGQFGVTDLTTTTGAIRASGSFESVRAKVSTGSVDVTGTTQVADAESTTGSVEMQVENVREVSAKTTTGSVELAVGGAQPQQVRARTTTGSIEVRVPDGGYQVQAKSNTGSVKVGVREDAASPNRIEAEAGTGSVRIN